MDPKLNMSWPRAWGTHKTLLSYGCGPEQSPGTIELCDVMPNKCPPSSEAAKKSTDDDGCLGGKNLLFLHRFLGMLTVTSLFDVFLETKKQIYEFHAI